MSASPLLRTRDLLAALPAQPPSCAIGFDGFVDEMISVVLERQSLDQFDPVPDIATFGALITAAAGHSSLREIVVHDVHPGGCAVNMGDGLCALGVPVDCFATIGEPAHPAFNAFASQCRSIHSWGREPGRTMAFEFRDGKLMFSSVKQLAEFTAEDIARRLADGTYAAACAEAGVIALTDWSLYPHMTGVWRLLQREVYSRLTHRPHFFIDLVDPSSRSKSDILDMLDALPGFEAGGPLTLGLNGNEANILASLTGIPESDGGHADTLRVAAALREKLRISSVMVHNIKYAVASTPTGEAAVDGPFCEKPKKSTGAGDRFNAGYALGLLAGGSPMDCIVSGCASSGYFVRNATSASRQDLLDFLTSWAADVA